MVLLPLLFNSAWNSLLSLF